MKFYMSSSNNGMQTKLITALLRLGVLIGIGALGIAQGKQIVPTNIASPTPTPVMAPTPTPVIAAKKEGCTIPNPPIRIEQPAEELTAENVRSMAEWIDSDCDGISNWDDNCAYTFNPKQEDRNKNGIGNACEPKSQLNRPGMMPNPTPLVASTPTPTPTPLTSQHKSDCFMGELKNSPTASPTPSPTVETPKQPPVNSEVTFTAIEAVMKTTDADCDGISDYDDNCVYAYNPSQLDRNRNGIGDSCEKKKTLRRKRSKSN